MKFIYADELKKKYEVFGHFYNLKIGNKLFQCRSTLEISETGSTKSKSLPNAVVIMMNPGSSSPSDIKYQPQNYTCDEIFSNKWDKKIVPAKPDATQYQIMRLMMANNWKYLKIINLSDLKNGNSGNFIKEFKNAHNIDSSNPHCITHENRKTELEQTLKTKNNGPIVAAWGSTAKILKESALKMLEFQQNIIGMDNGHPWYKHPKPQLVAQQQEWLKEIETKVKALKTK